MSDGGAVSKGGAEDPAPVIDQADHHKHMDYVQAVISRLSTNSFVMKGWALTLSSALLGYAASRDDAILALAAVAPAIAFWVLDTYYLRQERAFREMFADVAAKRVTDFKIEPASYAANQKWLKTARSISLSAFYGLIIGVSVLVCAVLAFAAIDRAVILPAPNCSTAPVTPAASPS